MVWPFSCSQEDFSSLARSFRISALALTSPTLHVFLLLPILQISTKPIYINSNVGLGLLLIVLLSLSLMHWGKKSLLLFESFSFFSDKVTINCLRCIPTFQVWFCCSQCLLWRLAFLLFEQWWMLMLMNVNFQ